MVSPSQYLQIGPSETLCRGEDDARAEFNRAKAIVCHDAFDPVLAGRLAAICARAQFRSNMVARLGHRQIESPPIAGTAIALMLRRAPLFRWLERVTGCEPITTVDGRVVRTHAVEGDELTWHDDAGNGELRRLGVTVALDSPAYEGGTFELRPVGGETLLRFKHDRPGTILIFAVSSDLEHRVLPLVSGGPRQVFTGWFHG